MTDNETKGLLEEAKTPFKRSQKINITPVKEGGKEAYGVGRQTEDIKPEKLKQTRDERKRGKEDRLSIECGA